MFKLASLIAIAAAAETAAEEKSKAEKQIAAQQKKLGKALKTGGSKIGDLFTTMPHDSTDAPTYADITSSAIDNCSQCIFAGGDHAVVKDIASCSFPAKKLVALKKANGKAGDVEGTDVAATVDKDLTYKAMFAGIEACYDLDKVDKASQEAAYKLVNFKASTSKDAATAKAADEHATGLGVDATVAHTGPVRTTFDAKTFEGDKKASFKFDWDHKITDSWGVARIVMPHDFDGGMYMSLVNADHTNVAVKVQGSLANRYFDAKSAVAANIGKQDKFPIMTAESIEFIMQKKSTWTAALDTKAPFSVTYTRASYQDIAVFTAEHGGAVVWIIVGCVVVAICCVAAILYKLGKCACGSKKDESDKFYAVEDCYARV